MKKVAAAFLLAAGAMPAGAATLLVTGTGTIVVPNPRIVNGIDYVGAFGPQWAPLLGLPVSLSLTIDLGAAPVSTYSQGAYIGSGSLTNGGDIGGGSITIGGVQRLIDGAYYTRAGRGDTGEAGPSVWNFFTTEGASAGLDDVRLDVLAGFYRQDAPADLFSYPSGNVCDLVQDCGGQVWAYGGSIGPTTALFSLSRLTFDVSSGVPEPATWLTMAAGFGAIGAGLRRRRAAAPA